MSQVLIDSSVWIEYFRHGNQKLERLISEDIICTNELILTELIPSLYKLKKNSVIESLLAIEKIPLTIDWDIVRRYQTMNLENGINKIGIPDLILMQQVIDHKLALFSLDKHFKMMQSQFQFELLT